MKTVTLTEAEWNYIGQVLQAQPFKDVAPLLGNLGRQLAMQPPAPPPKPAEEPTQEAQ
jgi:hypothetical protein